MSKYDAYVWTDGSCGKSGFGGCAAVLVDAVGKRLVVTRGAFDTTSQRMEMLAAIIGLERLWWRADKKESYRIRESKRVLIYSDSAYLTNCFIEGWLDNWKSRGWRTAGGSEVKNREMWETLELFVLQYKQVRFVHVKGHSGNHFNEMADINAVRTRKAMEVRNNNINRKIGEGRLGEIAPSDRPQGSTTPRFNKRRRKRGRL